MAENIHITVEVVPFGAAFLFCPKERVWNEAYSMAYQGDIRQIRTTTESG
ncbi:hypothetical protein [Paenibacillus segetis]|nr:hypothetical protein [Paenibacillus segetis]